MFDLPFLSVRESEQNDCFQISNFASVVSLLGAVRTLNLGAGPNRLFTHSSLY